MRSAVLLLLPPVCVAAGWTRFGGPGGDFQIPADQGPKAWSRNEPAKVWQRDLGDGYSSILSSGDRLYTMYRRDGREFVIALDAATGKTVWEHGYEAPLMESFDRNIGEGPRATPLLINNRLFTVGVTGRMLCLNAAHGDVIWTKDFRQDFGGKIRNSGYSPSPIAWKDTVIVFPGAPDGAVAALKQSDGSVVWKKHSDVVSYATPLLIRFANRDQMLVPFSARLAALDPGTGDTLWSHPHTNDQKVNAMLPIWHPEGIVFYASGYSGGSAAFQILEAGGQFTTRELWSHRLVRVHFSNGVRLGDIVYVSSGDHGPTPFAAIEIRTGKILWRDRQVARSALVAIGERFLMIDEDGNLVLASPGATGLKVEAKTSVLTGVAWTPPTIQGQTVFMRDTRQIAAYRLP
ncbi:MAG: PQQ-like beta-propeller repeat protein [Bryobacteraceae bacterium]|nr:PQQ-like beta-propeller repeat protein [Bryobacteraceae bacterium]